jgi:hypothetical protein
VRCLETASTAGAEAPLFIVLNGTTKVVPSQLSENRALFGAHKYRRG